MAGRGRPTPNGGSARLLLDGSNDDETRRFIARRRRLWLVPTIGACAVGALTGVLVAILVASGHHDEHRVPARVSHHVPLWSSVLGIALSVLGLGIMIAAVVVIVRRRRAGRMVSRWASPTAALTFTQRRALMKQIRGKAPVEAGRLGFTRDLARRLRAALRPVALLLLGLIADEAGAAFLTGRSVEFVALLICIVYVAVLSPLVIRDYRRACRFLRAHPVSAPTP